MIGDGALVWMRSRAGASAGDDLVRQAAVKLPRRMVESGATTVPPTITIAAPPAAIRCQYSASPGCGRPSRTAPLPWAVATNRLRRRIVSVSGNGSPSAGTRSTLCAD